MNLMQLIKCLVIIYKLLLSFILFIFFAILGTAFLLAPNIGVTALHVVENSIIENEKIYFVPLHDKPFRSKITSILVVLHV